MKVPLVIGAYSARSVIASAQRCVNIYPERNPEDSPFPTTHYLRPGSVLLAAGNGQQYRGNYRTSLGQLYEVVGSTLYHTSASGARTSVGTLSSSTGFVRMSDNGLALVVVDGSSSGWAVKLSDDSFGQIVGNGAFYGADWVTYLDTYLLFNRPGTNQWYISISEVTFEMLTGGPILTGSITVAGAGYTNGTYLGVPLTNLTAHGAGATADITVSGAIVTSVTIDNGGASYRPGDILSCSNSFIGGTGSGFRYQVSTVGASAFDPLDIAAKVGSPDPIVAIVTTKREIWLVGQLTSEIWYNAGAADFTFQALPGAFVEHGCAAPQSASREDLSIFWLSQDRQGTRLVLEGSQYAARRISNFAIEAEFANYRTVSDAVGFTFQQDGHTFYVLNFISARRTWVYDVATTQWHEWTWGNDPDLETPHPAVAASSVYGINVFGSYTDGALYQFDSSKPQDNGTDMVWRRGWPHLVNNGKRVSYSQFIADMSVANDSDQKTPPVQLIFVNDAGSVVKFTNASGQTIIFANGGAPYQLLRWSDARGYAGTWGAPIELQTGMPGQYLQQVQVRRLGMARDRVFELYGNGVSGFALNGAYVEVMPMAT